MDTKEIKKYMHLLIEENLEEIEIQEDGKTLFLRAERIPTGSELSPVDKSGTASDIEDIPEEEVGGEPVLSPMVGTFYRASSPKDDPFVVEGQVVELGQIICLIEAMKLFNEIRSEGRCEILKIFLESGDSVEHGQPLFLVKPVP